MREPIRVFVVDDHEMVRRGLIAILEPEPDMTVVGEAGTAESALVRIPATAPDVVLLDVRLPDGNGIEVCRQLVADDPHLAVLIVTSYPQDQAELAAAMAGAAGFFLKDIATDQLLTAIRRAAAGEAMLDAANLIRRVQQAPRDPAWQSLSLQERRVLLLIGEGLTNREIGERMYLAEKTVKHYVGSLLHKLGLQRRTQAASLITHLRDEGLVPDTESTT